MDPMDSEMANFSCSVCLDEVSNKGDRSIARLQCGHKFHLDCIGSAFNAKGIMQCPNCRKVEKGQWLFANGHHRSLGEFNIDDWMAEDDSLDFGYSEMPFGVHWCPFSGLAHITSFEDGEAPAAAAAYHDFLGHNPLFAEHAPVSSAAPSCPYMPYFHPHLPSSSSNSAESATEGPNLRLWGGGPADIMNSSAFAAVDLHYNSLEHHSLSFALPNSHINGADHSSASPAIMRPARVDSDGSSRAGTFTSPFFLGLGSSSSVMIPNFVGNAQAQVRGRSLQSHHQQPNMTRRSTGPRVSSSISPPNTSDHPAVFILPSGSSNHNLPDLESTEGSHFYAWERDRFAPYPLAPVDTESNWWGQFHHVPGGSDSSSRTGIWQMHSSERPSSHSRADNSHQPTHAPRLHPFI